MSKPRPGISNRQIANLIVDLNPRFEAVIKLAGICPIGSQSDISKRKASNFATLASSILSQQLSTKAAATIIKRVENLCGGKLNPRDLSSLSVDKLREAGCSNSKARAIKELALADVNKVVPMRSLHLMDDDAIMSHLLPLYGIGKWTVEMFLMFQLDRPDVWPVGDLGVRRGWEKIHRMRVEIQPKKLQSLGEIYAPYRSHVAWYCWRAVEVL